MIIVEGPDGAGKTTLVKSLQEQFGFEVGERGVADRDELYKVTRQDTWTALALAMLGAKAPVIWDRLFWSEFVYAPIVNRPIEFTRSERWMIQRILTALGCPTIVCYPPLEVVIENVQKAHQMEGVDETTIEGIYKRYPESFQKNLPRGNAQQLYGGWVIYHDYTGTESGGLYQNYGELVTSIERYLMMRKEREW